MTDEALRALERRFRETGAPDDEAAWLRERVRRGLLAPERVALAAHLGNPGAVRVAPEATNLAVASAARWLAGIHGLATFDASLYGRALVTVLELFEPAVRAAAVATPGLSAAVDAARAWVDCPCGSCADALDHARRPSEVEFFALGREARMRADFMPPGAPPRDDALDEVWGRALAAFLASHHVLEVLRSHARGGPTVSPALAVEQGQRIGVTDGVLRAAVARALLPRVLG